MAKNEEKMAQLQQLITGLQTKIDEMKEKSERFDKFGKMEQGKPNRDCWSSYSRGVVQFFHCMPW